MKTVRRESLFVALLVGVFSAGPSATLAQSRRPNIVVIVADDMGYGDIGVHGAKDIPTPAIDSIAQNGIRFTDAYVTGPYCSPTRAGLMTGRYPQRFGHEFNIAPTEEHQNYGLALTETTMAARLKSAGYRTAVFGKWHLGSAAKFHPMDRGFDEFFGFLHGGHSYLGPGPPGNPLLDGRKPAAQTPYLTDALADRAVDFIKRHQTQPFFLYLAFNAVHVPMQATDRYLQRFAHIPEGNRRTYAAMLAAMDDGIGRTLSALRAAKLEEHTLVVFFSDNGGPTIVGGVNGSTNAPLRGSKRQTYEGGIRVPFMMQWLGRLPRGRIDARPVIQLDVLPTALAAAAIPVDPKWPLDGINLLPLVTERLTAATHDALYWRLGGMMAIRKGDWKLLKMNDQAYLADPAELSDLSGVELYNLKEDIGESKNLAATQAEKVKELTAAWRQWNQTLARPAWPPPRPGQLN
jgi:arylsulfatase A-like enzyme